MDSNINMYHKISMRSLLYLEFLFKKFPEELVKIREYLPEELFVDFKITIDHFDRDSWKDYSSGCKRIRTERYYTHESYKEYCTVDDENFSNFIKINQKLISENSELDYDEYIRQNGGRFKRTIKREKDDMYDKIHHIKEIKYKYYIPSKE